MKDAVSLGGVQVPDQLAVDKRARRGHHAIDPFGGVEGLVGEGGAVVPLAIHVEIVATLEWDCAAGADFFVASGYGEADLAGHGGAADDGFVHV